MESNQLILENTTIHNSKITEKYVKTIKNNVVGTIIIFGIFLLITVIIAATGTTIAWVAVGILALCLIFMTVMNLKGLKASKESLSRFEGAIYKYKFYTNHFEIEYEYNGKKDHDSIKYTQVKQVLRNDGLIAFNLVDQTILFIDESVCLEQDILEKVYRLLLSNCQETLKTKRKKLKKK